jgi:hypothetical protein
MMEILVYFLNYLLLYLLNYFISLIIDFTSFNNKKMNYFQVVNLLEIKIIQRKGKKELRNFFQQWIRIKFLYYILFFLLLFIIIIIIIYYLLLLFIIYYYDYLLLA